MTRGSVSTRLPGPTALIVLVSLLAACHPAIRSTLPSPPNASQLAELWVAPDSARDLFWGVGGERPRARSRRELHGHRDQAHRLQQGLHRDGPGRRQVERQVPARGRDRGRRVADALGHRLSPAADLLGRDVERRQGDHAQSAAAGRFRQSKPALHGLDAKDAWSYYQNPFVGTPQLQGLLVLQAMLGNSDIKDEKNALYDLESRSRAQRPGTSRATSGSRSAAPA